MKTKKVTAKGIESGLANILRRLRQVKRVENYEGAGVLTRDRGLVVRLADGGEFQLTIIRSR